MTAFFLHGVPDTPNLWTPLVDALGLGQGGYLAPALPGFGSPVPEGFARSKEAYLDWLTMQVEDVVVRNGPVDLVGHDWGAALCLRLATLRPDLVRSWTVLNGVLEPSYRWHGTARIWQTPVFGEIFMAMARPNRIATMLLDAGMPEDMARIEAGHVGPEMKRSILKLYRSAKSLSSEWAADLSGLSPHGLVIWGDKDQYTAIVYARRFCDARGVPLHIEQGAGHWALCERPTTIAARLHEHWNGLSQT